MALLSLVKTLLPKEDRYFDALERQAQLAHEAAKALGQSTDGVLADERIRARIQDLEHAGDAEHHAMVDRLARSFVTPLDREDLQRISSELDEVLDVTNLVARCAVLFGLQQATAPMTSLAGKLVECTMHLLAAVHRLRRHEFEGILEDARAISEVEAQADTIYPDAVRELFHDTIDAKALIRDKEILGYLEHAVDECNHAATTLRNLAVKHT